MSLRKCSAQDTEAPKELQFHRGFFVGVGLASALVIISCPLTLFHGLLDSKPVAVVLARRSVEQSSDRTACPKSTLPQLTIKELSRHKSLRALALFNHSLNYLHDWLNGFKL